MILSHRAALNEVQLDSLDESDPYFDKKALDLQRRYDDQYELQDQIER